jgi:hypothetical protein
MEGFSPVIGASVDDPFHCLTKAFGADPFAALEPDELLLRVRAMDGAHELRLALDELAIAVLAGAQAEWSTRAGEMENEGRDRRNGCDEQEALEQNRKHCPTEYGATVALASVSDRYIVAATREGMTLPWWLPERSFSFFG